MNADGYVDDLGDKTSPTSEFPKFSPAFEEILKSLDSPSEDAERLAYMICKGLRRIFSLDGEQFLPDHGPYFGLNPKDLELRGERLGGAYLDEFQKQAAQLRKLLNPASEEAKNLLADFDDEISTFPIVWKLAQIYPYAMELLHHKTLRYLEHMCMLAEKGNTAAAQHVAEYAILTTKSFQRLAQKNSEGVKSVAEREFALPVMRSPLPQLNESDPDWEQLKLGAAFPFRWNKYSRVNPRDTIGNFAFKLWKYVFDLKIETRRVLKELQIDEDVVRSCRGNLPLELQSAILPEYHPISESVSAWWNVAKNCLVEAYPHPQLPGEINEEVSALDALITAPSQRRTPGKLRSHILGRLEKKFFGFAGLNRDKPNSPSWIISPGHIAKLRPLVDKLTQKKGDVSKFLWGRFSKKTRGMLNAYGASHSLKQELELKKTLAEEFNTIIYGGTLYQPERFTGVALSDETEKLLARKLRGDQILRLNRLLLVDAYAAEIARIS